MKKFLHVVSYEYTRHVLRVRFLLILLSLPATIAVMGLVGILLIGLNARPEPQGTVGYVDPSGFLGKSTPEQASRGGASLIPFASEAEAQQALEEGKIQAYYLLPPDYPQNTHASLVSTQTPSPEALQGFEDALRARWLANQPAAVAQRITQQSQLTVRSADGKREIRQGDWFNTLAPFLAGLPFVIAIFTSSGYLMQAVVEEKENRTMEIIITSVTPLQLMAGKIVGIVGVGLTQLAIWIGMAVLCVRLGGRAMPELQSIQIDPLLLSLLVLLMVLGFVFVATLMAILGATVTERREGQQIAGLFTLPVMIPYWFTAQLMSSPNGALAAGLSYFPLTAPVALGIRLGFTAVPTWQIALSAFNLFLSALLALWLAGRVFRLGMLRYGQRLALRTIFGRILSGRETYV